MTGSVAQVKDKSSVRLLGSFDSSDSMLHAVLVVKEDLDNCPACRMMIRNFTEVLFNRTVLYKDVFVMEDGTAQCSAHVNRSYKYANIIMYKPTKNPLRRGWEHMGMHDASFGECANVIEALMDKVSDKPKPMYGYPALALYVNDIKEAADVVWIGGTRTPAQINVAMNTYVSMYNEERLAKYNKLNGK